MQPVLVNVVIVLVVSFPFISFCDFGIQISSLGNVLITNHTHLFHIIVIALHKVFYVTQYKLKVDLIHT